MMNKYLFLLFGILTLPLVYEIVYSQVIPPAYDIFLLYQGYTIDAYNASGFSNTTNSTLSDLPDANPASLSDYTKPGIGLSMGNIKLR